ncbi:MAG: DUF2235 domain-containing protein, partial [Chloroflexi bacterium]|nr:DUF2235 domain-containing protein [Chloroflexota bacterium]
YRFIVLNYSPGDELFLFGFSRGAFTVRSLSGLISKFGVLDAVEVQQIRPTMDRYHDGQPRSDAKTHEVRIKFLGVWDTVGAMGVQTNRFAGTLGWWAGSATGKAALAFSWIPDRWTPDYLRRKFAGAGRSVSRRFGLAKGKYAFHDATLSNQVENGYHAVGIDERRPIFDVVLWNKEPNDDQHIEQVWFSGVHTEVGGGSSNEHTSAIALEWMSARARRHGMTFTKEFDDEVNELLAAPKQPISGSPPGLWQLAGRLRRTLGSSGTGTESVHPSAISRFCDPESGYAPPNLFAYMMVNGIDCSPESDTD